MLGMLMAIDAIDANFLEFSFYMSDLVPYPYSGHGKEIGFLWVQQELFF